MTFISICITLLTILATLYFLAKTKDELFSAIYKWIAYGVLLIAISMLVCQLYRGGTKMWHRKTCAGTECTSKFHGKKHGGKQMERCCNMEMCMMEDMDCCKGMKKRTKKMKDNMDVTRESSVDTIDGKIMVKETVIVKDKE